jgi:hypothetical protein
MFEAELMLRRALKVRYSEAPIAGLRLADSGNEALQRKVAG